MTEQTIQFCRLYETAPERVKSIVRRLMAIFKYGPEAAKAIIVETNDSMPKTIEEIEKALDESEAIWNDELHGERLPTVFDNL